MAILHDPNTQRRRQPRAIRTRQKLGKYRIEGRIDGGGFADVFKAYDTIEGIRVALKIPFANPIDREALDSFRKEVRLTAKFDHPNILPIKDASVIDGRLVVVYPLGECSLADRLQRRISHKTAFELSEQLLEALAYAHEHRVVHCDVKPDNLILFEDNQLRLADFGIAKVALRTLRADGTGTVGYIAPEQAMGKPSFRSDIFSAGLVLYRIFTGELPEWPFDWPMTGSERLRGRVHPDFIQFLRRAIDPVPRKRFKDGAQMLAAWNRIKKRTLAFTSRAASRRRTAPNGNKSHWKTVRRRQFLRQFRGQLEVRHECEKCRGPVSEVMRFCPWCNRERKVHRDTVRFPAHCPRCRRGVKSDWRFCAWCYGGTIGPLSEREYSDKRYQARCPSGKCTRRELMPFMRYCPWCNARTKRVWKIVGSGEKCRRCGWGVVREFWDHCPWCAASLQNQKA